DLLLPALHGVQDRFGWIPPGALNYICRRLSVPPAEAYGVATFYHLLSVTPKPPAIAHVCDDIACRIKGGESLCQELATTGIAWKRSPCLGQCERAPAALVIRAGEPPQAVALAPASRGGIEAALQGSQNADANFASLRDSIPQTGDPALRLIGRIGRV